MFKLDNAFLEELGLGALPPVEKNKMLAHIYETLEMRVGMKLAEQMSNEQLDEFESYINRQDEAGALKWLESNFPNYKAVVAEELEKLKAEISQVAPQIVAQSQENASAQQQVQPPAEPQVQAPINPQSVSPQQPAPQQYAQPVVNPDVAPQVQPQPYQPQPIDPQLQPSMPPQPMQQPQVPQPQPPVQTQAPQQQSQPPMPQQPWQPE
jgi:hypothetical protein